MAFFTSALEALITYFHFLFNDWGLTILAMALAIRVLLFPIQLFNFKQQVLMRKIQPATDELTALYKTEPMKLYKEMAALKKRNGVHSGLNMLSSLVQLPIFLSIYKVFSGMQSLKVGKFAWLSTLGAPDPFFVFPALVALTIFLQQKLKTLPETSANSSMILVMKVMPLVSLLFMVSMPAGLVAYYALSGFLQLAGDWILQASQNNPTKRVMKSL